MPASNATSPACVFATSHAPPSRHANPFATCWTRPGALPFIFPPDHCADSLIAQLAAQQWRGAIIGPHGSGKSTLLETLKPCLRQRRFHVHQTTLQSRQRRLPDDFWLRRLPPRTIIIIDGYEQLGWLHRVRLNCFCRRRGWGLLVTAHTVLRIPALVRLAPDERLVQRLVGELTARVSTPIEFPDVAASHACHGSNVREILFDLYDRHEQFRRAKLSPNRM